MRAGRPSGARAIELTLPPTIGGMARRYVNSDGRTVVDLIRLTLTGTNKDGEWFRVSRDGWLVGRVRTREQLARLVDLADLREALRALAPRLVGAVAVSYSC